MSNAEKRKYYPQYRTMSEEALCELYIQSNSNPDRFTAPAREALWDIIKERKIVVNEVMAKMAAADRAEYAAFRQKEDAKELIRERRNQKFERFMFVLHLIVAILVLCSAVWIGELWGTVACIGWVAWAGSLLMDKPKKEPVSGVSKAERG